MHRHYFNPTPDTIYTNKGGGSYICLEAEGHFRAKFQRVSKYKWTGSARRKCPWGTAGADLSHFLG